MASSPAGPGVTPVRLALLGLGAALIAWGTYFHPGLNTLWQAPLGAVIFISALGKMTSR